MEQISGFVEWLDDDHTIGIVRLGLRCRQEPDYWDFAFVIVRVGDKAIWKALLSPQWGWPWWLAWLRWIRPMPTVTLAHTRAAYVAVAREGLQLEKNVEWDRLRSSPRRMVSQFSGDEKGKITMKNVPSANDAIEAGHNVAAAAPVSRPVINNKKVAADMRAVADLIENGTLAITNLGQADSQAAAIRELARATSAIGEMKSDESFGWAMRDNKPGN